MELGDFIAAPYCARLLADAGADVVKVEHPGGDSARREGPFLDDHPAPDKSALFAFANRGKRSIVLDPASKGDRDVLLRLVGQADVLVHDFSSLAESPVRVDGERLRSRYPSLIVTSITPFGESGPHSQYKADDLVSVCMGGVAWATPGFPDYAADPEQEPPLRSNAYISEFIGGGMGAVGTMVALLAREMTGQGESVEVSKQEALACMLFWDLAHYGYGGEVVGRHPVGTRLAPNHYLPCADGWMAVVAFLEHHWHSLLGLMDSPSWAQDPRFATGVERGANWHELEPLLLSWLLNQPAMQLFGRAQSVGIPIAPALSIATACENEQAQARQYLVPTGIPGDAHGRLPGNLYFINGRRRSTSVAVPRLGQHTRQVLKEWLGVKGRES